MASLVAHLFSCKQELIQCEDKVTRDIAENLLKELYRLEDTVKWWGYLEDTHFEQLDGIAQNIVYGQVPGYQKVDKLRDTFNENVGEAWPPARHLQLPLQPDRGHPDGVLQQR